MAAPAVTAEEQRRYLAEHNQSDLGYLLNESGVSVLQQYKMSFQGIRNVRRLSERVLPWAG